MTTFTEEDVKKLREFGFFLNQKAEFNHMSISDSAKLVQYLHFYNQLAQKVEDHVMEVVRVQKPAEEKPAKPKKG